ncbi:MAG: IS21-like element helper ATPase IstB [Spirochaetales bacterium]|nr:IS21-like element helper ATPase IstB [Spirochaetales bacterium]
MSRYARVMKKLEELRLNSLKDNLDEYIELINKGKKDVLESLEELLEFEIRHRKSKAESQCIKVANFPFQKDFSDYDFDYQPSVNSKEIMEFKNLRFIEKKENIILVGNSGVGKTHLAVAIGRECSRNGYSTYFITCHDLLMNLKKAHLENRLEIRLNHYRKYRVLIIDEIGYLPFDISAANMLFQLINKRYTRNSTIITTNSSFSKWAEIFGDTVIANAILDRLLHHSNVINITGNSYRTRNILSLNEKRQKRQ